MVSREEKRRRMDLRRDTGTRELPVPPAPKPPGPTGEAYLEHFACLPCRKSFKRGTWAERPSDPFPDFLPCPDCGGLAICFGRKFKPPKRSDIPQWRKVRFLAENGFWFRSGLGAYPATLAEAREFVQTHKTGARKVDPQVWQEIESRIEW